MAKKQTKFSVKSLLSQFMQKSLQSLISVAAEHSDHLVEWIKNISGFKRKIRALIVTIIFLTAGIGVFGVGIAQYLASLNPKLANGISYLLVGIALVLVAVIYSKINE